MSSNIPSILISLTKIIIRYHDIQVTPKIVDNPSQESLNLKAKEIISKPADTLKPTLQLYIDECTKGYLERKPFLNYILYQIEYLQTIAEKKIFNQEEIDGIAKHIHLLIKDVQGLLNTPKGTNYIVTQDNHEIKLSGLASSGYYSLARPLCNSGNIALEELLGGLNISLTSTDAEISSQVRDIVERISLESQLEKLTTENQELKDQLVEKEQVIQNFKHRSESSTNGNDRVAKQQSQTFADPSARRFSIFPSGFSLYSAQTMARQDRVSADDYDDQVLNFSDLDIV